MVPRAFSVVRMAYGEPHWVDRDAQREDRELRASEVGAEIDALAARVDVPLPDAAAR